MASGGLGLFLPFVLGLPAIDADSQTPIRVLLDAPPDCSTPEAFFQGVRDRTDRVRAATAGETSVELGVRLVRTGTKVQGELRMRGERGESDTRRVEGATCQEVVEALSLTAALALDPQARLIAPPPEPPPPERAPPVAPPPPLETTPPSAPPRQRSSEFAIGVQALVTEVVTPEPSIGGSVFLRLTSWPDRASGESISVGIVHLRNDLLGTPDLATYRITAFMLTGCPLRLRFSRATILEPCATTLAGWLGATGANLDYTQAVIQTYWSVGGTLVFRVGSAPGPGLDLSVGATMPVLRRQFTSQNPDRILGETPVISAFAGAGVNWAF